VAAVAADGAVAATGPGADGGLLPKLISPAAQAPPKAIPTTTNTANSHRIA
jgi:hypothetical protein